MPSVPTPIPFEQALSVVTTAAQTVRPAAAREALPLLEAQGRVLAEPIVADRDQPPFPRSTRDGYALQAGAAGPLTVVGQLRAGQAWRGPPVTAGAAVEIMTGAPLPAGADAVLMLEHAERAGDRVTAGRALAPGDNVVAQGAEAARGQQLVHAGTRITAAEIALAASCGYLQLSVFGRPRAAIIATGDELVEVSEQPDVQQIRNSNTYGLAALCAAAGATPVALPIARDIRSDIHARITAARGCDLLILSGGVSMGAYDLVEEVLGQFGAEFLFDAVAMQPGKPVVFGRLPADDAYAQRYFFGLPGNPISTQVTFHVFVEPFLRALAGEAGAGPRWAQATLAAGVKPGPPVTRLLPARLEGTSVTITPWQGSGDLAANARANCYAELLAGSGYRAGEVIRILLR